MVKFMLCFMLIAVVKGSDDDVPLPSKVACTVERAQERENLLQQVICGEPKEQLVDLQHQVAHEQVSPKSVWVKRCIGLCDFDTGDNCVATGATITYVQVRIFNAKTNKETCATLTVEEHVSCGCGARRMYNPRKSTCQCPKMERGGPASRRFVR